MLSLGTGGGGLSQYTRLDILNLIARKKVFFFIILFVLKYVKKRNNHISYLVAGGVRGHNHNFRYLYLIFWPKVQKSVQFID